MFRLTFNGQIFSMRKKLKYISSIFVYAPKNKQAQIWQTVAPPVVNFVNVFYFSKAVHSSLAYTWGIKMIRIKYWNKKKYLAG